jgi:hypothetical protein
MTNGGVTGIKLSGNEAKAPGRKAKRVGVLSLVKRGVMRPGEGKWRGAEDQHQHQHASACSMQQQQQHICT